MDFALLPALLALALLDSLNPSALVVALWLLSRPQAAPRLLAYVTGILAAYLGLGIAMMLGFGALRDAIGDALDHPVALLVQGLLGAALLAYGIFAPKSAHQAREPHAPAGGRLAGYVALGMTVTAVELVTALPYFAAVALMLAADLAPLQWLPLLLAYNAIFVAPPLLLLALHALLGSRTDERFARWRQRLQRGAREAALWIFAIVGVALLGDAVSRHLQLGSGTRAEDPSRQRAALVIHGGSPAQGEVAGSPSSRA
ncbi:GAP family protein [Luteimonas sp. SJ-92]|uniref:GAP family protein n=1 Tax=Luteimonas salinisoli TaxID=2752307 RepID=A0A853JE55_9GAMM|nr:GAP family protein [Luteimonas salinisoli]NZA27135.1 GAP family protein [Luteimonas salinisoli]